MGGGVRRAGQPRRVRGRWREAAESLGVMAAFVGGGLAFAGALRGAASAPGDYPALAVQEREDQRQPECGVSTPDAVASVWLVDGFNVLCAGVLRGRERASFWSEANRRALIERVARFDDPDARLVVVFDGQGAPDDACARPESVYAPSADDWIVARVRESAGESIAVVTADRQLAGRARHRGAAIVAPRAFLARCRV